MPAAGCPTKRATCSHAYAHTAPAQCTGSSGRSKAYACASLSPRPCPLTLSRVSSRRAIRSPAASHCIGLRPLSSCAVSSSIKAAEANVEGSARRALATTPSEGAAPCRASSRASSRAGGAGLCVILSGVIPMPLSCRRVSWLCIEMVACRMSSASSERSVAPSLRRARRASIPGAIPGATPLGEAGLGLLNTALMFSATPRPTELTGTRAVSRSARAARPRLMASALSHEGRVAPSPWESTGWRSFEVGVSPVSRSSRARSISLPASSGSGANSRMCTLGFRTRNSATSGAARAVAAASSATLVASCMARLSWAT